MSTTSQIVPATTSQQVEDASSAVPTETSPKLPYDLSKFKLDSILSNATNRKLITCLGRFVDRSPTDQAILLFEKNPFDERHFKTNDDEESGGESVVDGDGSGDGGIVEIIEPGYFSLSSTLTERFTNDIYGTFECFPNPAVNCNCILCFVLFYFFLVMDDIRIE